MCESLIRKADDQRERRGERALQKRNKKDKKKPLIIYKVTTMKNLSYYIKLLCNNCPYILKCQNKLIMKKRKCFVSVCLDHHLPSYSEFHRKFSRVEYYSKRQKERCDTVINVVL